MKVIPVDAEIELRIRDVEDAERTLHLINESRETLRQWLPWVDYVQTIQDCKDFIEQNKNNFAAGESANYGIYYHNELVGLIGYHKFDNLNHKTTIGYWLGRPYHGKGIMTRAAEALTKHAFENLQMNRVEIHAATENFPSQAVPKRLGFTQEGVLRQAENLYGTYVDLIVFGKLKSD